MVNDERRICIVDNKAAYFHCWSHESEIHQAVMVGDVSGIVSGTFAVIEHLDGSVALVYPDKVKLCDTTQNGLSEWKELRAVFLKKQKESKT